MPAEQHSQLLRLARLYSDFLLMARRVAKGAGWREKEKCDEVAEVVVAFR